MNMSKTKEADTGIVATERGGEPREEAKGKIFGIGLSRTGTLSLTIALRRLGYHAIHTPVSENQIEEAEALTDSPIACRFEELDERFPGSLFVQTMRDVESWLASCRVRFSRRPPGPLFRRIRRDLYGTVMFDEAAFRAAYHRFNERVESYFSARPRALLKLNIFDTPDPWHPLCEFLGKPHPDEPFPHKNRRPGK